MKIDVLVAEIGSTTTVVNAFHDINTKDPKFLGQGQAATSVLEGDVRIGLNEAVNNLAKNLSIDKLEYEQMLATSSAAGGLKMTVHGLVYDMTARAAKEAALGAGAIIHMVSSGKLIRSSGDKIKKIEPNIILIAGGVDGGESETALFNAQYIRDLDLSLPLIYAGNCDIREEIKKIFEGSNYKLFIVDNVYPSIDKLNVEPTRKVIQEVFEEHIVHAKGMEHVRDMVNGPIIPTPGAVMESAKVLYEELGDLIIIDVGGATSDLHSVTPGSDEFNRILISPEPLAKRTVEGDLGVYVNMPNIVKLITKEVLEKELDFPIDEIVENYKAIPETDEEFAFVERLSKEAVIQSVKRHAGRLRQLYSSEGRSTMAEGKDLTQIKNIIATGGALTRLPNRVEILKSASVSDPKHEMLAPRKHAKILIDNYYIFASLGVLSRVYKEASIKLMKKSLGLI